MTEPLAVTAIALRATISEVLDDAVQDAGQNGPDDVDTNRHLNRIMNAVGEYVDAIITRGKEHICLAEMIAGPALVYIHTDGKTVSAVDRGAIDVGDARERVISRALITEALRLLDSTEASPATYRPLVICACGHPAIEHTREADGCAHCACRQCCDLRPGTTDYCIADSQHTDGHIGRSKNTWTNR